jgi:CRISPR/Cas system CMR-associated protein Cmr5 small subunit
MRTRAQQWSDSAYRRVSESAKNPDSGAQGKYKTSCMKMPGLIHQSGALQALVFQVARDAAGRIYVDHLAQTYFGDPQAGHAKLIAYAQQQELRPYMAMTRDLAEIAQWFRRFAQIEFAADVGE